MTPHEYAQLRLAYFWDTVKKRGLTTMAEIYRRDIEETETAIQERNREIDRLKAELARAGNQQARADNEIFHLNEQLATAEKKRDDFQREHENAYREVQRLRAELATAENAGEEYRRQYELQQEECIRLRGQLAQRRDMTLTAEAIEELTSAVDAMESAWHELSPGDCTIGDQFIRQNDMRSRINKAREALERWSREGEKSEPQRRTQMLSDCDCPACRIDVRPAADAKVEPLDDPIGTAISDPCAHGDHLEECDNPDCACKCHNAPDHCPDKPPAPDLAALREKAEDQLYLVNLGRMKDETTVLDALRNYIVAVIDARQVKP